MSRSLSVFLFLATVLTAYPPLQGREELTEGFEKKADLVYARAGGRDLHLDLFLPWEAAGKGSFPALVYIHGGGWRSGSKDRFHRQAAYLAKRGFIGASIEYRLSREAKFPAALEDAKAAVRWLRANARRYNVDLNRIGAVGNSAGGHLAALLATTSHLREFEGKGGNVGFSSQVQVAAIYNAPLDLVDLGSRISVSEWERRNPIYSFLGATYHEDPDLWRKASPLTHVSRHSSPFLLLHGTEDRVVPYPQSLVMMEKLKEAGVPAEMFTAQDAGHSFLHRGVWFLPALKKLEEFFKKTLR